ncbi:hypothetical protein V500_04776 [Pseudogymnoascus sp. VKM F-4518 (FW-2643)]|nr:hypothetical protein V500_04776 [Pseudogymnoascus sp. VKM F-4518 (FW-2643)]
MFVANKERYGPWELLQKTDPGLNLGDGAPGYYGCFVSEEYFTGSPATPPEQKVTWLEWFYVKLDVTRYVPIGSSESSKLLTGFAIYLQEHRPEKFLGALRISYQQTRNLSPDLIEHLRLTEVLCRGNQQVLLKDAYFLTEKLERRIERFVELGTFFPWLWLDTETTYDAIPSGWKDLLDLLWPRSPSTDLNIALDMLKYFLNDFPSNAPSQSRERLFDLYHYIESKYREHENRIEAGKKIRNVFSKRKYIYIPMSSSTCAFPNDCVWKAPQEMKTKFALQRLYEPLLRSDSADSSSLAHFFTSVLKITDCTWETYVEELKELKVSSCENSDTIAVVYRALDALRPTITSVSMDLLKTTFESDALIYVPLDDRPVWHKVSQCVWSSAARLRGRVSLNENYKDLEDLFVGFLGVKPVNLLMAIDELKEAGNRRPTSVSEINNRAYALLRIAAHFGSPRTKSNQGLESFYKVLRGLEIRGTDGISSSICLSQDGVSHEVEGKKTTLYIDDNESGIKIYVPRNKDDQEYTFTKLLSQRLFEWMMRDSLTQISEIVSNEGINATRDVLLSPRTRLATALDDNGIGTIITANIDEVVFSESESLTTLRETTEDDSTGSTLRDQNDSDLGVVETSTSSVGSPSLSLHEAIDLSQRSLSFALSRSLNSADQFSLPTRPATIEQATPLGTLACDVTGDPQYVALLDRVIAAARHDTIPSLSHASVSMRRLRDNQARTDDGVHRMHYASQFERNCKIGAAGELYIFELLSHLRLSDGSLLRFPRCNWQSNIRKYVNVHPAYSDLMSWDEPKTSDIVYSDISSVLTGLLIDKGYLNRDVWGGAEPKYFIEVKTTVSSYDTPFYMSKAQYARMQRSVITGRDNNVIYIIFRVYHLGRENMGLEIYLDPESLRLAKKLSFTPESWSIVPANA